MRNFIMFITAVRVLLLIKFLYTRGELVVEPNTIVKGEGGGEKGWGPRVKMRVFSPSTQVFLWRRDGLVVSASYFQPEGRWFEPGLCRRVVSLDKKLCSTLSLSTQVYKWVPAT